MDALFHDEEIDGPLPERLRVLVLTLAAERAVVAARVAGLEDVDLVGAEDVPDGPGGSAGSEVSPARGAPSARAATGGIGRPVGDGRGLPATGAGIDTQVELLRGALRTYAWGSRTAIAEFTGRPVPAAHPEAELWFGAHPGDPAWLETGHGELSLLEALVDDPEGQLGAAVARPVR